MKQKEKRTHKPTHAYTHTHNETKYLDQDSILYYQKSSLS